MATKILIDTDPGIDDTMAILFALRSPELEVVGLTTVFGNTNITNTSQNALRLVELEGHGDIPVAMGAGNPLINPIASLGEFVHGPDGMGGINPPPPAGKVQSISAAQFIVDTVLSYPNEITLVPVGPLTNIALARHLEPRIAGLVKEVVIMGGAAFVPGNASPVGEANILNDPHAAAVVFGAPWPVTMVGLDVTMQVVMTGDYLEKLGQGGNPATDLIRRIVPIYQQFHDKTYGLGGDIHTHDPSAVAFVVDRSLFETAQLPMFVETQGRCAGQTIPDLLGHWDDASEVNVCRGVEAPHLLELFFERLTA
jgi:uridine nucleosidase